MESFTRTMALEPFGWCSSIVMLKMLSQNHILSKTLSDHRVKSSVRWLSAMWSRRSVRVGAKALLGSFAVFFLFDLIFPFQTNIHYAQIVTAADSSVVHAFLSADQKWRMKTELAEISPLLRSTIIRKEDRWFYWHPGVNPISLIRALGMNIRYLRTTSGASTITMQVARLLQPRRRTLWAKCVEAIHALQLELHYSKDEILQMYLNLVPYGGNLEGVKAASLLYFNCLPQQLSLAQVVCLSVIPNRPTTLRLGQQNTEIIIQRDKWLRRFDEQGVFEHSLIQDALLEPTVLKRVAIPHSAPHYALRMRSRFPSEPILYTTLNARAQHACMTLCFNYVQRTKMLGIYNCSVMVINNKTRNVEAYVGSADFDDREHAGQCDGVQAVRSPGSALKPLLYAAAFDAGLLTPKSIVSDVPIDYNGYAPENYDQSFHGAVTVEEALAQSLNIPAVKTLHDIGVQPFAKRLSTAGFRAINADAANVGLSLALGGCGVRLEEMARLYSCFACGGELKSLHWIPQDVDSSAKRLISPAASYMITEILTKLTRPDLPNNFLSAAHIPKVAWKTGTSYGRRDAWSIGYNKHYTIAVWVGNFSGEGIADLTGSTSATPLLFELFNTLDYNSRSDWYTAPKDLDFRIVCAESGLPPGEYCTQTVTDYFIPTVSPPQQCTHLVQVAVSDDGRMSYCTSCLPQGGYRKIMVRNYAPELLSYYKAEHVNVQIAPPHNPACMRVERENAPRISSPVDAKSYIVNQKDNAPLMLSCTVAPDVRDVYWYLNDKLIQQAKASEQLFIKPQRGRNKISCCDDKGRNTNVFVTIEWE